ncbi:MAG TPA: GNAT family N-acetyltransferase [Anaerolineaceae bacterium]
MTTNYPISLTYHEICSPSDPIFQPWLDLYETAFPPEERLPVSFFLRVLVNRSADIPEDRHLIAVFNMEKFTGLICYWDVEPLKMIYLWYFAVVPEGRNQGTGKQIYHDLVQMIPSGYLGMMFDVETPAFASDDNQKNLRSRRIDFYRRNGARLVDGVYYMMQAGPFNPEMPMHIMIHPLQELNIQQALEITRQVLEKPFIQTGTPHLV